MASSQTLACIANMPLFQRKFPDDRYCSAVSASGFSTKVLMAMPLYLLYEISVIIAYIWFRQDQREEEADSEDSGR